MDIRETQIEDIFINSPVLIQNLLELDDDLRIIGRQIQVPSGRLDMLFSHRTKLLLIELKVAMFQKTFVQQVLEYRNDLLLFQKQGKLLNADIIPYLLIPEISQQNRNLVENQGIKCITYEPTDILDFFFNDLKTKSIASFVEKKPIDIGIWNLHLINKFIYELENTNSIKDLQNKVEGSSKTLYNKIKFSTELGLVEWKPNKDYIYLSDLGNKYVKLKDDNFTDRLNEQQTNLLRQYVAQNPYQSSVILGIASVVESVFTLAKNIYPVPLEHLADYFTYHSGKIYDWQTDKAKKHGMRMYSNYAIDLGLLARTNQSVYLTPEGYKFTVQMQMHKGLKILDGLTIL